MVEIQKHRLRPGGEMALRQSSLAKIIFSRTLEVLSSWRVQSEGMLYWGAWSGQGWQNKLSLLSVCCLTLWWDRRSLYCSPWACPPPACGPSPPGDTPSLSPTWRLEISYYFMQKELNDLKEKCKIWTFHSACFVWWSADLSSVV